MNIPSSKTILSSMIALPLLAGSLSSEDIPVGIISAQEQFVLTNTHANITWQIAYPIVTDENGNPSEDSTMQIRLLGSAMGQAHITLKASLDGDLIDLYSGHGEQHPDYELTPGTVAASVPVDGGTEIEFHIDMHLNERFHNQVPQNNGWVSTNHPAQQHMHIMLLDGDEVPIYDETNGQRPLREIISAYLDEDGKVSIGENSVLYSFEAWTDDTSDRNFDMQDIVVLVTYSQNSVDE